MYKTIAVIFVILMGLIFQGCSLKCSTPMNKNEIAAFIKDSKMIDNYGNTTYFLSDKQMLTVYGGGAKEAGIWSIGTDRLHACDTPVVHDMLCMSYKNGNKSCIRIFKTLKNNSNEVSLAYCNFNGSYIYCDWDIDRTKAYYTFTKEVR